MRLAIWNYVKSNRVKFQVKSRSNRMNSNKIYQYSNLIVDIQSRYTSNRHLHFAHHCHCATRLLKLRLFNVYNHNFRGAICSVIFKKKFLSQFDRYTKMVSTLAYSYIYMLSVARQHAERDIVLPILSVVCPSVCLSNAGTVSKRMDTPSHFFGRHVEVSF